MDDDAGGAAHAAISTSEEQVHRVGDVVAEIEQGALCGRIFVERVLRLNSLPHLLQRTMLAGPEREADDPRARVITQPIVVEGPYRHVRNPMIAAVLAFLAGEVLLFGSPALLPRWLPRREPDAG